MNYKFALLTTENSPINEPVLNSLRTLNILPHLILVDGQLSEKDLEITLSRMTPGYQIKSLNEFKLEKGIVKRVSNHNSKECIDLIKENKISYLVNAGTIRILKSEILKSCLGALNCHPGLLPMYRGCSAVEWAIFNNEPVGATVHFMTEGIDEGPIVKTATLSVKKFETYESIRTRMNSFQGNLLGQALLSLIQNGKGIKDYPTQGDGHYNKPISTENLVIVKDKLRTGDYFCPSESN